MISADKFLEEVVNKPILYYVYAYYDEKLEKFNTPFVAKEEPEVLYDQLKTSLIKKQVEIKNMIDLDLVLMGTVDLKTGSFDLLEEYKILLECNKFINVEGGHFDA